MELKPEQTNKLNEKQESCSGDYLEGQFFSEEELENISGLCDVLQSIRKRLISEGFSIEELRKNLINKGSKVL